MDANTNKKTLAVAFAALLVGSLVVVAAPVAAHDPDGTTTAETRILASEATVPGTGTDVLLHFDNATDEFYVAYPTDGELVYNTTYDMKFTNLPVGSGEQVYLAKSGDNPATTGTTETAYVLTDWGSDFTEEDGHALHDGAGNATFSEVELMSAGTYLLTTDTTDPLTNQIGTFTVGRADELTVTLSTTTFAYTAEEGVYSTIVEVRNNTNQIVRGASVTVSPEWTDAFPDNSVTNPQGRFVASDNFLPGVGTYTVTVTHDINDDGVADIEGTATFTVTGLTLRVSNIATTAFVGFDDTVRYNVTFPEADADGDFDGIFEDLATSNYINVSIARGSERYFVNTTGAFPTAAGTAMNECDGAGATCDAAATAPIDLWVDATTHQLYFAPASGETWASGTHTFTVDVDSAGSDAPDYTGTWTLVPTSPSAVNLKFEVEGEALDHVNVLTSAGVDPKGETTPGGAYTLTVFVYGSTLNDHPLCDYDEDAGVCEIDGDALSTFAVADLQEDIQEFIDDLTVEGDLLPGWSIPDAAVQAGPAFAGSGYDPTTGAITINGVWPTEAGNIRVGVPYQGTTTFLDIPVENGGLISLSVNQTLVDNVLTLEVTLQDAFGGAVTSGVVDILREGSSDFTFVTADDVVDGDVGVVGTGAAGRGQNGVYRFSIEPTSVQDLFVYGQIGTSGAANENYTWAQLRVTPAHDLNVTLTPESTMAALETAFVLNATSGGEGVDTSTAQLLFLTEDQYEDYRDNNTGFDALTGTLLDAQTTGGDFAFDGTSGVENLFFNATLDAGTYYVIVCDDTCGGTDARHDNADDPITFVVHRYNAAFSPSQVANSADIQEDTEVTVTVTDSEGNLVNGTLTVLNDADFTTGDTEVDIGSVTIRNGEGTFTTTGTQVGDIAFEFDPEDDVDAEDRVTGVFKIVGPDIIVDPEEVPLLETTFVTVTVRNFTGAGLPGRVVRICSESLDADFPANAPLDLTSADHDDDDTTANIDVTSECPDRATTGSDGTAGIPVTPTRLAPLWIYVNGSRTETSIPVIAGALTVSIDPAAPEAGDNVTVSAGIEGRTSSPAGIVVTVQRDGTQILQQQTGSAGQVVLAGSQVTEGNYTIVASKTGFRNATTSFTIGVVTPPPTENETENETGNASFNLSDLTVPASGTVGSPVTVTVSVNNDGNASGTATVEFLVNGNVTDTEQVEVAANESETATFEFTPNTAQDYEVTVRLQGEEALEAETVTVSTPTTTTPPTPTSPTPTSPTPTSPTPTSPTPGTPTPTTPEEPEPQVPGFEVVALIGALGAALLVLRRRS